MESLKAHPFFKDIKWDNLNNEKVPFDSEIIYKGMLKKTNKYYMVQDRYFTLSLGGEVTYFKDKEEKGQFQLCPNTKSVKTGKDKLEI